MISSQVQDDLKREILEGNPWYVGSQFEWAAKPYVRRIYERRFQFIVSCIERARSQVEGDLRLLDAGCGDGYWLSRLEAIPGVSLTGIEYNPLRIERARKAAPTAKVYCDDLQTFSSPELFHVVILSQVIEHVHNDVDLLVKMRELLVPGGTLILGTPNEGSFLHRLRQKFRPGFQTDHVHFYIEAEITRKITSAGFRIENVMYEVFFFGINRIYNWLNSRSWGFLLLEKLAELIPSECSDYYFECLAPMKETGS